MLIDCESCVVRGLACGDCVVTVILGAPPGAIEVDAEEQSALDVLAKSGLVPRLQMVPPSEVPFGTVTPAEVPVADVTADRRGYRRTGTAP